MWGGALKQTTPKTTKTTKVWKQTPPDFAKVCFGGERSRNRPTGSHNMPQHVPKQTNSWSQPDPNQAQQAPADPSRPQRAPSGDSGGKVTPKARRNPHTIVFCFWGLPAAPRATLGGDSGGKVTPKSKAQSTENCVLLLGPPSGLPRECLPQLCV